MSHIRSPKQRNSQNALNKALRYYAAFSPDFVQDAIRYLKLNVKSKILDPWNGSGTTTYIASKLGIRSFGYDLNPAVKQFALCRLATKKDLETARRILSQSFENYSSVENPSSSLNTFHNWFDTPSVVSLSKLKTISRQNDSIIIQAAVDVAIIKAIREQLGSFKSTNPSWIRVAHDTSKAISLNSKQLQNDTIFALRQLSDVALTDTQNVKNKLATIATENAKKLPLSAESVDAVITSPPYCTRIDYAIATLVELAWLGMDMEEIKKLRKNLTGTITVGTSGLVEIPTLPKSVQNLLCAIKEHPSKASSSYYYKTYFQFFIDMQLAFKEMSRVVKPNGKLCIVVQDSFYKEIPIQLSCLFEDMLHYEGFELLSSHLYPAGGLNLIHGNKSINEVALTCRKRK